MSEVTITASGTGSYVVSLAENTPSPRYGTGAGTWTSVQVEEAAAKAGAWTLLGSAALSPLDTDPAQPQSWDITVKGATLAAGWYTVTFLDAAGNRQPLEPVFNGPDYAPSLREIAALMPDRTTVDGSGQAGMFTSETQPSAAEIEALIGQVLSDMVLRLPATMSPAQAALARNIAALTVAVLAETGRFADQVDVNDAKVGVWERMIARYEKTLTSAIEGELPSVGAAVATFGSVAIASPTVTAYNAALGSAGSELIP